MINRRVVVRNLFKGCLADYPFGLKRRYFMVFGQAVSLHNDLQRKHFKTIFKHNQPLINYFHSRSSPRDIREIKVGLQKEKIT